MNIISLQLLTNNLKQTHEFYSKILGLEIIESQEDCITFKAGSSTLTFIQSPIPDPLYHFAFNIPSNKFEEALAWMEAKVEILPVSDTSKIADYTNWNAKAFYFFDFTGNIVELIARFDLNNYSDQPFTSSSIAEISEIGIVVDDVYNRSEEITSTHHLPIFSKQPRLENFAAIGDDNGLFIVVDKQKNWFPTNLQAKPFPAKATIHYDGRIVVFEID